MRNVIIGYQVTHENAKQSRVALDELRGYMDLHTEEALDKRWSGLYLFNTEVKTLIHSSMLIEADVQKEVEEIGSDYISMTGHSPGEFKDEILKIVRESEVRDDSSNPDASISVKNDRKDHKLRWDLIPMEPLNELAKVYTAGADKYGPDRWQNLDDGFNRYRGAAFRHLYEYMQGNRYDEETKCMHLAQCAWNVIAMLWLDMHGRGRFPFKPLEDGTLSKEEYNEEIMKRLQGVMSETSDENIGRKDSSFDKLMKFVRQQAGLSTDD